MQKTFNNGMVMNLTCTCLWPDIDVYIQLEYVIGNTLRSGETLGLEGLSRVEFEQFIVELRKAYDEAERAYYEYNSTHYDLQYPGVETFNRENNNANTKNTTGSTEDKQSLPMDSI